MAPALLCCQIRCPALEDLKEQRHCEHLALSNRSADQNTLLKAQFSNPPGGSDCFSLSALSESVTDSVYKYLLQRTLNFVMPLVEFFLILTLLASFLRAVSKKSLISLISFGCRQS